MKTLARFFLLRCTAPSRVVQPGTIWMTSSGFALVSSHSLIRTWRPLYPPLPLLVFPLAMLMWSQGLTQNSASSFYETTGVHCYSSFHFNFFSLQVVNLDSILCSLATDQCLVAQLLTRLLIPSYFPSKVPVSEACNHLITLVKCCPLATARFCEYAMSMEKHRIVYGIRIKKKQHYQ